MSSSPRRVLLDTNILVHLIRYREVGQEIDRQLSLSGRTDRPLISVVTVGEIMALAAKRAWGEERRERLQNLVRNLVIVHLQQGSIIDRYAAIDRYSEREIKPARPMGQNDMWIGATASATEAALITTDPDFDHLTARFISLIRIDSQSGRIVGR